MSRFIIQGGRHLKGRASISGAKNSALPIMAACLLTEEECSLKNIPNLSDIKIMWQTLEELGARVKRVKGKLFIDAVNVSQFEAPYDLVRKMRASILVLGPLLARVRRARVAFPGGCSIGIRPINLHLEGLSKMGAQMRVKRGYVEATAPTGLQGANICLDFPSVGATENLILAACLAKGTTVIKNASCTPEVVDLARFLRKMGTQIEGEGTDLIKIKGSKSLSGVSYSIIPDRIETGTLILAAAITRGKITLEKVKPDHSKTLFGKLREMGIMIETSSDEIMVSHQGPFHPVRIKTLPYPGFPTDLQPQLTALACLSQGTSTITETIFENRFAHLAELRRMGAQIEEIGRGIIVKGIPFLWGCPVSVSDIRGGAALVLAGLAARGETELMGVSHIDRGYEELEKKLSQLGAKIVRLEENNVCLSP